LSKQVILRADERELYQQSAAEFRASAAAITGRLQRVDVRTVEEYARLEKLREYDTLAAEHFEALLAGDGAPLDPACQQAGCDADVRAFITQVEELIDDFQEIRRVAAKIQRALEPWNAATPD
jgi:hypothetical protein